MLEIASFFGFGETQTICSRHLSEYLSNNANTEEMGKIFIICGETLEDIPEDYLLDRNFLRGYIEGTPSDDPNIRECSFVGYPTYGELISTTKAAMGVKAPSLKEIRDHNEIQNNPTSAI